MISIGSNIASLQAQRRLSQSSGSMSQTMERLSSGQRINRASVDAAGLAIATSLKTDARVFTQGVRNLNDGVSMISITSDAMGELSNIVTRISELAEQASNGVYSNKQRLALDQEAQQLRSEYKRITQTTSFNNMQLLNGSISTITLQGGYSGIALPLTGSLNGQSSGTGTFTNTGQYGTGSIPNEVAIGDLNGDGFGDLAIAASNASASVDILIGNGDGTFKARTSLALSAPSATGVQVADLNGDGNNDIVVMSSGNIDVFIGNGNGTFKARATYTYGSSNISLADFNGDGKLDIVAGDSNDDKINILLNNGDGTFKAYTSFVGLPFNRDPAVGDFNGDGIVDILFVGQAIGNNFGILLGNGNGSFKAVQTLVVPFNEVWYPGVADINHDGFDDIVSGGTNNKLNVFLSNGDGTFKAVLTSGTGANQYYSIEIADFNGDDLLDVLTTDLGNLHFFAGDGNGLFQNSVAYAAGTVADTTGIGDVNGDGVPDIGIANFQAGGLVTVFVTGSVYNGGLSTFSLQTIVEARDALDKMRTTLKTISSERARIGGYESRISSATDVLRIASEQYITAASQIADADVAYETSKLVKDQILQEAGAAILAQANTLPALALTLLNSAGGGVSFAAGG